MKMFSQGAIANATVIFKNLVSNPIFKINLSYDNTYI